MFKKLIKEPKIYYLRSNAVGFLDNEILKKYINLFFQQKFKPNLKVLKNIDYTLQNLGLVANEYVSVHVRCGDFFLEKESGKQNVRTNHLLVNIDEEEVYIKYAKLIEDFKIKHNINIPIIIHSDSKMFKRNIQSYCRGIKIIDNNIAHCAVGVGKESADANVDTITEFYIISNAKYILSDVYSGFSHMASLIKPTILFTSNRFRFKHIHLNNIWEI